MTDDHSGPRRRPGRIRVGTSGFDYAHWVGPFYPTGLPAPDRLAYYADRFDALELNVTFYRMPPAGAFERWRDVVPPGFRFAVKASRYLTHVRRLDAPRAPVEFLMDRASRLGDRLGPVLLQLPPTMEADLDRLDATLDAFGASTQVAVEPRHQSWFTDGLAGLLRRHGAALCLADRRGPLTPLWRTAPWLYLRLHEGRARPASCYGEVALRAWAGRLAALATRSGGGYVFFNNDQHACAVANAVSLRSMLDEVAAARGPGSGGA